MMSNYPVHRTPEQGHTRRCLAKAMIAAVENLRDDAVSDLEFRTGLQEGLPLQWADLYLTEGMTVCLCPDLEAPELVGDIPPTSTDYPVTPGSPDPLSDEAVAELAKVLEDLDSIDLVRAEEGSDNMAAWLARWLPKGTPWEPVIGTDLSTTGIEYYTPAAGTVRVIARTV